MLILQEIPYFLCSEPAHYSVNLKNSFNSQKIVFRLCSCRVQRTLWALFKKLISLLYKNTYTKKLRSIENIEM